MLTYLLLNFITQIYYTLLKFNYQKLIIFSSVYIVLFVIIQKYEYKYILTELISSYLFLYFFGLSYYDNEDLKQENKRLKKYNKDLKQNNENLNQENENLNQDNEYLEKKNKELEQQIIDINYTISDITIKNTKLENKLISNNSTTQNLNIIDTIDDLKKYLDVEIINSYNKKINDYHSDYNKKLNDYHLMVLNYISNSTIDHKIIPIIKKEISFRFDNLKKSLIT